MERRAPPIDWSHLRQRLARTSSPADEEERRRRVLAARAHALATPPPAEERPASPVVELDAGDDRYALLAEAVVRVERVTSLVRLPGAPPFVLGIVPVGSRPCPLLHLGALLGSGGATRGPVWAVLLGPTESALALGADAVSLSSERLSALHPAAHDPERVRRGVTGDGRVVLDAAALLAHALRRVRGEDAA